MVRLVFSVPEIDFTVKKTECRILKTFFFNCKQSLQYRDDKKMSAFSYKTRTWQKKLILVKFFYFLQISGRQRDISFFDFGQRHVRFWLSNPKKNTFQWIYEEWTPGRLHLSTNSDRGFLCTLFSPLAGSYVK